MSARLHVFLLVFTILNFAFVPLLSLYGLRVCPVLTIPGFALGCIYTSAFIVIANLMNLIAVQLVPYGGRRPMLRSLAIYGGATVAALIVLQIVLNSNHVSGMSRGPEVLIFASLLLGITQAYGLNWVHALEPAVERKREVKSFRRLLVNHVARTMAPVFVVVAILMHFLIRQSVGLNRGRTAPPVPLDETILHFTYLALFLAAWLLVTFTFHFLSERDLADRVQLRLKQLREMDFHAERAPVVAWGLWEGLFVQLNSFAKILGERMRLLKSFSRFVTEEVAKQALKTELRETSGETRELTVIMSDVRDFTSISEKLAPHEVVTLLNEYFTAMLDVINHHGVCVDKFIGDGILAYVEGETVSAFDDNRAAVDAAFAMIDRLQSLNVRLAQLKLPALQIGVGIYRGPVVIGFIGTESKLQHTIIGDTVNRAARLEGLCRELKSSVVVCGEVWQTLSPEARGRFQSFGARAIKGLNTPLEIFGRPV